MEVLGCLVDMAGYRWSVLVIIIIIIWYFVCEIESEMKITIT